MKIPSLQGLIALPLLETLRAAGGSAKPGDIYDTVADRLGLDRTIRQDRKTAGDGQSFSQFDQQVRWARQTAVVDNLIDGSTRGTWTLTDEGYAKLAHIERGSVVVFYRLSDGLALCARAEDAARIIAPDSLQLILTSPPYPTIRREYGRMDIPSWLAWMHDLVSLWKSLIRPDGTIAVNVMDVFEKGTPCLSPYVERFTLDAIDRHGLHLAGRLPWHSPTKLGHIEWAAKRKVRPRNSMEHILLFSKSPFPAWDATRLPRETSTRSPRRDTPSWSQNDATRPSGLDIRGSAFQSESPGRFPGNLIIAGGASGNDGYSRSCRAAGVKPHPARFPLEVPRRIIQLTTAPGDTVYDPMAGSGTTAQAARELGRRFITSDAIPGYVASSAYRFPELVTGSQPT